MVHSSAVRWSIGVALGAQSGLGVRYQRTVVPSYGLHDAGGKIGLGRCKVKVDECCTIGVSIASFGRIIVLFLIVLDF